MREGLTQAEDELRRTSVTAERQITPNGGEEITLHLNRLPLGNGEYEVEGLGRLYIGLRPRETDGAPQVYLGCHYSGDLVGSKVQLNRYIGIKNGYGSQMIGPNRILRIDTGDHKEKSHGRMHPVWRNNNSLAGPNSSRRVWVW